MIKRPFLLHLAYIVIYASISGADPGFPERGFICIKVCVGGGGGGGGGGGVTLLILSNFY